MLDGPWGIVLSPLYKRGTEGREGKTSISPKSQR